jgi:NAD+-dependent farnesol dehydrogenase
MAEWRLPIGGLLIGDCRFVDDLSMDVLVTGASGYVGSAIVRALARDGHTAIAFARTATRSDLPGTRIDGDVRDREAVTRAATGVDAICHTAAVVSIWRPRRQDFDEINIGGLQTVIDVCRTLRIPRLVYTSSFLARPPADGTVALAANDYQRTKVAALELARSAAERGVPIVSLYPGVVYGPGAITESNLVGRLVHDHLAGRLPGVIGADRIWSFTYVDDVARAHVAALTARHTGYQEWAVGGENAPQMRLFELLREATGKKLPRRIPLAVAYALGALEELRAGIVRRPPLLTRGVVEIFRHDWTLDSQATEKALDYTPTPLQTGLRQTLDAPPFGRAR